MKLLKESNKKEMFEINYENLPITIWTASRLFSDSEPIDTYVDWTFEVSKDDVITYLIENVPEAYDDFYGETPEEILVAYTEQNFYYLTDKYNDKIEYYFEDAAIKDAEENYGE